MTLPCGRSSAADAFHGRTAGLDDIKFGAVLSGYDTDAKWLAAHPRRQHQFLELELSQMVAIPAELRDARSFNHLGSLTAVKAACGFPGDFEAVPNRAGASS